MKTWTLDVKTNESGEHFIELPQEALDETGWKVGDRLKWIDQNNGSWKLEKPRTQLVLVEAISQFRQRYVVEVPVGNSGWALDTVTMEEAQEFSQKWLGETITSHRIISEQEVIKLFDEDNDYLKDWSDDKKLEFITEWSEDESKND